MNLDKCNGGMAALANDICDVARVSNGFVLELGVFAGNGSTLAIQEGLSTHQSPLHISVDWDPAHYTEEKPSVPWWHYVVGDTRVQATLDAVKAIAGDRRPGVIFIDTDHNGAQMKAELGLWSQLATPETVWLYHDTYMYGPENTDMVQAIREFASANGWVYEDWRQHSHGLGRMVMSCR